MRFSSSWRKPLQPLPWRAQLSSRHCHPDGQPRPERGVRLSSTHPPPQGLLSAGWEQVGAQAAALTARPPATSCDYWLCPRPVPQGRSRGGHRWHGAEATLGLVSTLPPRDHLWAGSSEPIRVDRPRKQEALGQDPSPSSHCHSLIVLRKATPSGCVTHTPLCHGRARLPPPPVPPCRPGSRGRGLSAEHRQAGPRGHHVRERP